MAYIFLVLLIQTFWSASYTAMKFAMGVMPVGLVLILRYGIAALLLASIGAWRGARLTRRDLAIAIIVGLLDFSLSPYLQLISLTMTRASDASVVVALEPLVTACLATLLLRERLTRAMLLTFLVATVGVLIMSGVRWDGVALFGTERVLGNLLFFGALLCEAAYSVTGRGLVQRYDPLKLATIMMTAGAIGNLATSWRVLTITNLQGVGPSGWVSLGVLAVGCSAFGYAAWVWVVKRVAVTQLSLSLFLQPIIGSLFGYYFLDEQPTLRSMIGAGLTLASLLVWLLHARTRHGAGQAMPLAEGESGAKLVG